MWGYWVRNNPNIKRIRYFFMLGISNEQTNQLIASCLQKTEKKLSEWPGLTFDMGTDEGHALLGSPNGATFAYFLIQHKAQLGAKTISKVTIIRPESDDNNDFVDASLVFHVVDAQAPPPDEETKGTENERDVEEKGREKNHKEAKYVVPVVERKDEHHVMVRVHEFRL